MPEDCPIAPPGKHAMKLSRHPSTRWDNASVERHPSTRWDNASVECSCAVVTFRGFCPWQCPRLKKERRLPGHVDATQWIDVRRTTARRRRLSRGVRLCITDHSSFDGLCGKRENV